MGGKKEAAQGMYEITRKEEEHLKKIKKEVEKRIEIRRNQGGMTKQQEEKIRDYHQWGTTDFYENILMPQDSAELEQELKIGPPEDLSKAEKKSWRVYRENRYKMALTRENFFRTSQEIKERALKELEITKDIKILSVHKIYQKMGQEVSLNTGSLVKEKKQEKEPVPVSSMVSELSQLMEKLKGFSASEENFSQIQEMMETYGEIERRIFPVKILRKSRKNKLEISKDSFAGVIFLTYATTSLLTYCLEQLPIGEVNAEGLAKVKGLSAAYGILADKIELSSEFKEKVERETAIEEKKEAEQGQKRREEEESILLNQQLIQKLLMEQREKVRGKTEGILGFSSPKLEEEILSSMVSSNLTTVFEEMTEEKIEALLEEVIKRKENQLLKLSARRDYIINNKQLAYLSRIPREFLLKLEQVTELIWEETSQNTFEDKVRKLEEQVSYTLTLMDDFLEERLSPLSRKEVSEIVIKKNPSQVVFGTFTRLWNYLEHFMQEVLPKECPGVIETEEKLLKTMKNMEINREWKSYVFQNLTSEDKENQVEKKLMNLKHNLMTNEALFTKTMAAYEFPREKWAEILEWKKKALDKEISDFKKEMKEEISREDFVRRELISLEEYLQEEGEEEQEVKTSSIYSNKGLLKWDLLCRWEGFEEAFYGLEDTVMEELNKVLKKGSLKPLCPFLENIQSLEDLEALTFRELQFLTQKLRSNISKGVRGWIPLVGVVEENVWKTMISEMILGTLQESTAVKRAEELEKQQREYARIDKFRIRNALRTVPKEEDKILKYHHLDDTTTGKWFAKESRPSKRMERFRLAAQVWKVLKDNGMEQEGIKLIAETGIKTGSGERIHKELKSKMEKLLLGRRINKETERIANLFLLDKIKDDEYVNEFRLCQMEGFLLDKKYDEKAYHTFTSVKLNAGYKELLRKKGEIVSERILEIDNVIKTVYGGRGFMPSLEKIRMQMGPLIAGLEEGKEEENLERFGVRTWQEALRGLKEELISRVGQPQGLGSVMELCYIRYEKTVKERKTYLEQYEEGILRPLLPVLLEDREFWQSMTVVPSVQFLQQVEEKYEKVKTPLLLLKNRYSYGEEFIRQLIEDLGKTILQEEKSGSEWNRVFQNYFEEFCTYKIAGYSISGELKRLQKKEPEMASYLSELLLTHPEGLNLIDSKEKFEKNLLRCKTYVKPNTKTLEIFLKAKKEPIIEATETGFRMYAKKAILNTEPEKMMEVLPKLWEEFRKLEEKTKEEAVNAKKAMEEKKNFFFQIEERMEKAREEEQTDQEQIERLRSVLKIPGSLLLAVLGVKKIPSPKDVENAREKLKSYGNLSQAVSNCLLEILLSGMEENKVKEQLQWLIRTEEQILSMEFAGTEKLKEKALDSFLTFLYIRHQAVSSFVTPLTKEQIKEEFRVMGGRLLKMKELRNKSMDSKVFQKKEDKSHSLQENALFMTKRRIVTEAASVGMFLTPNNEEFEQLVTRQSEYLEKMQILDQVCGEVLKELQEKEEEKRLLRIGLIEYFRADMGDGFLPLEIKETVKKLLTNENSRAALLAVVRMSHIAATGRKTLEEQVLDKEKAAATGKILMEGVGSTTLQAEEKKFFSTASRETLESFLAEKQNQKYCGVYNRLDREQRKVFALCVLQMEKREELPSMKFIRSDEIEKTRQHYVLTCLEQYAKGKEFHPEIFYDRVIEILCSQDGRIDGEIFRHAMEMTAVFEEKRRSTLPKDYTRLQDAKNSIGSAKAFAKEAMKEVERVSNLEEWRKVILAYDEKSKGPGREIKERLQKMNGYQLPLLIAVLQDRTVLDFSTQKGKETEYANPQERERVIAQLQQGKGPRMVKGTLDQALLTLRSYQLRDDVEFINHKLDKNDFAPKALERKTGIDWKLLEKALDFVKELEE